MVFGDSTATGYGCAARRRSARRADRARARRAVRQANPAEHQGDRRRDVEGPVRPDRRDVRRGPAAGRRGDHDRRQRHHQPQRHRPVGAPARRGGAPAAGQRRRRRRRHLPGLRRHHRDPAAAALVARSRGLRLARAQAAAVRAAGGVPVPFSDLLAPEFRQGAGACCSRDDMFHPSAAGYALAAKQLLPALCNALGEWTDDADARAAVGVAGGRRQLAAGAGRRRQPAVAAHDGGPRADRGARRARFSLVTYSHSIRGAVMPEAVIVSTARSPIGRAGKGSLVDMRPDDLAAQMVRAALDKVPVARPARHRRPDHGLRAARRRGGLQHRPRGRRRARLRLPARHHGQPVLLVVAADHPDGVPRDQGRRGQRVHLRGRRDGFALPEGHLRRLARLAQPAVRRRRGTLGQASSAGADEWHDPREDGVLPDVYIAMGQTAENVALLHRHQPRRPGPLGRAQPEPRRGGHQQRLLRARDRRR